MRIVVLTKPVPDPAAGAERLGPDHRLDRAASPTVINGNDEYALEAALQLVEAHGGRGGRAHDGPRQRASRRCARRSPWAPTAGSWSRTRRSRARTFRPRSGCWPPPSNGRRSTSCWPASTPPTGRGSRGRGGGRATRPPAAVRRRRRSSRTRPPAESVCAASPPRATTSSRRRCRQSSPARRRWARRGIRRSRGSWRRGRGRSRSGRWATWASAWRRAAVRGPVGRRRGPAAGPCRGTRWSPARRRTRPRDRRLPRRPEDHLMPAVILAVAEVADGALDQAVRRGRDAGTRGWRTPPAGPRSGSSWIAAPDAAAGRLAGYLPRVVSITAPGSPARSRRRTSRPRSSGSLDGGRDPRDPGRHDGRPRHRRHRSSGSPASGCSPTPTARPGRTRDPLSRSSVLGGRAVTGSVLTAGPGIDHPAPRGGRPRPRPGAMGAVEAREPAGPAGARRDRRWTAWPRQAPQPRSRRPRWSSSGAGASGARKASPSSRTSPGCWAGWSEPRAPPWMPAGSRTPGRSARRAGSSSRRCTSASACREPCSTGSACRLRGDRRGQPRPGRAHRRGRRPVRAGRPVRGRAGTRRRAPRPARRLSGPGTAEHAELPRGRCCGWPSWSPCAALFVEHAGGCRRSSGGPGTSSGSSGGRCASTGGSASRRAAGRRSSTRRAPQPATPKALAGSSMTARQAAVESSRRGDARWRPRAALAARGRGDDPASWSVPCGR